MIFVVGGLLEASAFLPECPATGGWQVPLLFSLWLPLYLLPPSLFALHSSLRFLSRSTLFSPSTLTSPFLSPSYLCPSTSLPLPSLSPFALYSHLPPFVPPSFPSPISRCLSSPSPPPPLRMRSPSPCLSGLHRTSGAANRRPRRYWDSMRWGYSGRAHLPGRDLTSSPPRDPWNLNAAHLRHRHARGAGGRGVRDIGSEVEGWSTGGVEEGNGT